ncbi:lysosomal alpha-mannosidase isoform X2 [Hylaeus volcanicus]|uniref:lysosomal alpha-mannosidase isoform X2 n=1 Tax=Hylaeus volcanicus TaxID=313075 RepID=UPI0023B7CB03|nr:lysosomal alpha-mannosidase isoform X2 [Hylaeus volcanicus]
MSSRFSLSLTLFLAVFIYGETASIPGRTSDERCGYEACQGVDPNKLNIHLVAHTHDDVGWLKTVDQYYFGSRPNIQKAGVQYILDGVIQALLANPERRFMYVETAFLWKWWLRQNEKTKQDVRNLINEGRLEIIGGGWSMNDEAVTHYHSLVDQYTWGFRRLNDTFGRCATPRIGWQIDPFGHSREQASIFAQLGFDGMFLGRLDYQDKENRLSKKNMEFIWQGSPNLGSRADLFTVALYNTYSPPPGFCFDVLCNDEPIIDDPDSPDYNVKERINEFLQYAVQQAKAYRTNNVILTMGGDFTFQQAEMYFVNMDKLIRYVREETSNVNILYSTPSCYLKAVHDANLNWSTKTDDFFPYGSDPHSYWTGFFSSRPSIKFFERMGNNVLQVTKQLSVLTDLKHTDEKLEHFREAMGVMQHHDAVTGTEKQLVADDYARILYNGIQQGTNIISEALRKWMTSNSQEAVQSENMYSCMQLNISSCSYTEDTNIMLTVYNPLSREIRTPIRVPVRGGTHKIVDLVDNSDVTSQLVPIPNSVLKIPGRESNATHELVFLAVLPSLGYKTYKVVKQSNDTDNTYAQTNTTNFIDNEFYDVSVNTDSEVTVEWKKLNNMSLVQSFHYYEGMEGNNRVFENRSSGAYIFRPKSVSSKNFPKFGSYKIYKGPVLQEIHQAINEWVSQVIRLYNGQEYIEFDWLVGPIPVKDSIGKEVISKYSSNLNSNGEFYTDSNGREMLKRKRNFRPTWAVRLAETISGNYYPVPSKISVKDEDKSLKLSVLTDRTEGGSSMRDGEIELMLHRRLLKDDGFGVGEALNESAYGEGVVVRGSHYVFGGSIQNLDEFVVKEKSLALETLLRPWTFFTPITTNPTNENYTFKPQGSGLAKSLPPNIHVLTLEPWKDGTVLLRLEHIVELGEAENLSKPVEINIQDLFKTFTILSVEETTLGGNEWLEDTNRLKWEIETNDVLREKENIPQPVQTGEGVINVLLKPMEIRTFVIKTAPRNL